MAELRITFTLSERDLKHLREILRKASAVADEKSEAEIIRATEEMVQHVRASRPPTYILSRVDKLETLIGMLKDDGWPLTPAVRHKAIAALAYFTDPHDLIPDAIPGLGFLDDAIMIELVVRQLRHELDGYARFRLARHAEWERPWHAQTAQTRERRIAAKRKQIRRAIRAKEEREAERARQGGIRSRFL